MKANLATLKNLLLSNVAEIKFIRKRPKPGFPPTRRMLCTNCATLLNSNEGRVALNYKVPTYKAKFNEVEKNVLITWDIFMQNFRCINLIACEILSIIPANKEFWNFFNQKLARMSAAEKISFMNK